MKKHYFIIGMGMLGGLLTSCSNDSDPAPGPVDSNVIKNQLALNSQEDCKSDVSWAEACSVAANSYNGKESQRRVRGVGKKIASVTPILGNGSDTLMYVVSYGKGNGYVVISGTKKCASVLAYSNEGDFDATLSGPECWVDNMKTVIAKKKVSADAKWNIDWLQYEKSRLSSEYNAGVATYANADGYPLAWWRHQTMTEEINRDVPSSDVVTNTFCTLDELSKYVSISDDYFSGLISSCQSLGYQESDIFAHVVVVGNTANAGPLLTTSWTQNSPYIEDGKGPLGCVTVAIGQLMYYYKYPAYLDWNAIGIDGSAIQMAFLKEIGEKLGFNYNIPASSRGTGQLNALNVLKSYGYNVTLKQGTDYKLMVSSLNYNKPFICGGTSASGSGHDWVVDGFQDRGNSVAIYIYAPTMSKPSNGRYTENPYNHLSGYDLHDSNAKYYFHMNWGWGEKANSWNVAGDYTLKSEDYNIRNTFIFKN